MKKVLSILIIVVLMTSALSISVFAYEEENDFNYSSDAENIIVSGRDITTKGDLKIPEKYNGQDITVIDSDGFDDYTEITSATIPNTVSVIENSAFQDCINLSKINLPNGLVKIGKLAFDNTSFANNIKNWTEDRKALYLGTYLISVNPLASGSFEIKEGTTLIADSAFEGCKGITNIKIPKSVKYIGKDAFRDSGVLNNRRDLRSLYIDNCLIHSDSSGSYVVNEGTRVIADGCFMNNKELSSVVIPNTVQTIGQSAFLYCPKLDSISIGSKVDYIGEDAFLLCESLSSISVSSENKTFSIKDGMLFSGNTLLRCPEQREGIITLDENTSYIGNGAFSGCKRITAINFSNTLKGIGESAFSECGKIDKFVLPDSLQNIGNFAFAYCYGLTEIKFPDTIEMLGHSIFSYCSHLEKADLGRGVTEIPAWTFQYCENLKYVDMTNINKTGYLCFYRTSLIDKDSNFDENGMLIIDDCLLNVKPGFTEYNIPEGTRLICADCFEDCGDIELITLPKTLEYIDSGALYVGGTVQRIVYSGTNNMWNERDFAESIGKYPVEGISMIQDIPYEKIIIISAASIVCIFAALLIYLKNKRVG